MLELLIVIALMVIFFKFLGLVFRITGAVLGGILGIIGYLLLGILAISAFGMAFLVIPVILIAGGFAIGHWLLN